jgi:hypothetical protein
MAVGLAQQLLSQLEAKISAMPNDPDKFLMRVKLNEQADILRVSFFQGQNRQNGFNSCS